MLTHKTLLALAWTALSMTSMDSLAESKAPSEACPPTLSAVQQGEQVFHTRCAICHGANADGQSNLAKIMTPKPANLRASLLDLKARTLIISKGGAAVGRSPNMPTWEPELTAQELQAVIAYVGSVKATP